MKTTPRTLVSRWSPFCMLAAVILLLEGCGGGTLFKLMDDHYTVKPASIGVITGGAQEADMKLAELLTKELKQRTTLQVISQEEVSKAIPSYPVTVKFQKETKDGARPVWFDPTEKRMLDQIQAHLDTTYLFVVWGEGLGATQRCSNRGGCTTTYHIDVYGNMLEYPGGKVVSHTAFSKRNSDSFLALFRSKGYYIEQMLEDSAEGIVDEFIKVTHTGKAGK